MDNTQISCIRLVPYKQFTDGTWGTILVLGWQTEKPSVFLFNSAARKKDAPNTTRNSLLPEEAEQYARYIEDEPAIVLGKDTYARYGVVRLCGGLVSAHIADLVCKNLNKHDPIIRRNEDRVKNRLAAIQESRQAAVLEEELLLHADNQSEWQRSILEQILPLVVVGYNHGEWIHTTLLAIQKLVRRKNRLYNTKEEAGIRAVAVSGICRSKSDWGAVFKILTEKKLVNPVSYLAGAKIINQACEAEVTTASAIKQSPALVILGGKHDKGWTDKVHNRQSANLVLHYQEIADIFMDCEI